MNLRRRIEQFKIMYKSGASNQVACGLQIRPVSDPVFPRGGANPKWGTPTYYSAKFSRTLPENENNGPRRGGTRPSFTM